MGLYLNGNKPYVLYKEIVDSPYFVDKSTMLSELIPFISSASKYVCITRPRRFGKTVMVNMAGAFFSKGVDSSDLFDNLAITRIDMYRQHLNQHNVIYIDFSKIYDERGGYQSYISDLKELLREDLHENYKSCRFRERGTLEEDLNRIYMQTENRFIFLLDEWDAIFHMSFISDEDKKSYLLFLKRLLKDQPYVSLAYMTGILPISKYSSGSELNMFLEYTMATEERFGTYFGFTETEVDDLFLKYLDGNKKPKVTRDGLRTWYDGYHTLSGERMYNPRSVATSLTNNNLSNYWTNSGPYDEIFYYIEKNVEEVRDDLALMISGEAVKVRIREYAATAMNLQTKDEIFSAMVVYGFLSYQNGSVSIPNKELMDKFTDMLYKEPSLGYINRLTKESNRMLLATLNQDTKTMLEILEFAHDTEVPLLSYNNETDLTAIVNLVYLSARDSYRIEREDKAGIGYVDFIFYPETDRNADCIILELKVGHTPEEAIRQIKIKKYALRFKGKLGEKKRYTGKVLAVGISYDKDIKKHQCLIEVL